ncbi:hypothetical protein GPECTOR_25g463 [Gonium pectorale]|uniref:Uncharacterized protein n=1 Tax=Gonium pectorale TaxID=33097 RepID=A0A150GGB2_GONPE|nr:hypothetical protein GPECTOR_25g463 [Gonium pectorale]|eukprot:KXZ48878.1 hypothetical protein GPECTOR_25g463 [Gonium pectorale]
MTGGSRLEALLRAAGQPVPDGALANLSHVPLFKHFEETLTLEDHYVSPHDAEMAELQLRYEEDPELAEREVLELLELHNTDPELFASRLADAPELRDIIEEILRQEEISHQAEANVARGKAQMAMLQESSNSLRLQQKQAEQGLARMGNLANAQASAAATQNSMDNRCAQAVQECARVMKELLHTSAERWLFLAHPMDELREVEKAISMEVAKAKEQLCPAELAQRLAQQGAAKGALPDTPFAPSVTRMLTGLAPEQCAYVLREAADAGTSRRLMRDQTERLQAELAGLQQQEKLLQQIADGTGGLGSESSGAHPEGQSRLALEAEQLRQQVRSLFDDEHRQSLLDQLASMSTAQVKKALWLLRHQQLGYMQQLQKQLGDVLMEQWARTEVAQMLRAGERRTLHELYLTLCSVCSDLREELRANALDVEEFRSVAAGAEAQALLARDRGTQALLGSDPFLCASFTLVDEQRQRLQRLVQENEQHAGLGSLAAADAALGLGAASQGLSPSRAGAASPGSNAFLDSLLSDPSQRSISQLADGVEAVAGLMARLEQQLQQRVCSQAGQLVAEGRARMEELHQMLAGPQAQALLDDALGGGAGTASTAGAGPGKQPWPVLRDPAFAAELATSTKDVAGVIAQIQAIVDRSNVLTAGQSRQSEQTRLERGLMASFWNTPAQLVADVQALRDRLAAMLNSV